MAAGDHGAARRLQRLARPRLPTGLLGVGDAAALGSVGFAQVSEVIGAVANSVIPGGFFSPGPMPEYLGSGNINACSRQYQTYTSSSGSVRAGVPATITALKAGYRAALSRLLAEAKAVGADGVVDIGVTRTVDKRDVSQLWQFLAVGTAIRSTGRTHTEIPFTTDLSGSQCAAALRSGYVPISLLMVPCMAIRAIDYTSRQQKRRTMPNAEIEAYTDLINTCRHQARQDFALAARHTHAEAAVMTDMRVEFEAGDTVATAQVSVTGTTLGQFRRPKAPPSLTIIPIGNSRQRP